MTDIVERLRNRPEHIEVFDHLDRPYGLAKSLEYEAADEIERLRQALRDILQAERWNEESFRKGCDLEQAISRELMSDTVRIARAALGKDRT